MNMFDLPPFPLSEELTTVLYESGKIRIERIGAMLLVFNNDEERP